MVTPTWSITLQKMPTAPVSFVTFVCSDLHRGQMNLPLELSLLFSFFVFFLACTFIFHYTFVGVLHI